VLLPVCDF